MIRRTHIGWVVFASALCLSATSAAWGKKPSEDYLQMVVKLLSNNDPEFRGAALEQVRTADGGAATTRLFAEQLPTLSPAAQVGLLSALGDRGDAVARPAVLALYESSQDETVRAAALSALGQLGDSADLLPLLVRALGSKSPAEQAAARRSLTTMRGDTVTQAIAQQMPSAEPAQKAALIEVLAARWARKEVPAFLTAAVDDSSPVRTAAMAALGQLANSSQIAAMLPGVLKAAKGAERDAAEKDVALVCSRINDDGERATALIRSLDTIDTAQRDQLLGLMGRVGGKKLIKFVADIATCDDPVRRKLGIDALSKWPDASVADQLLDIAEKTKDPAERTQAFQGFVKISAARDKRSDKQRLDRMKQAMKEARTPAEQTLVINRSRTAYDVDTLRFVLPYVDDPQFAQTACETIVELAHHREIRDPNKAEFDKALDKLIATSKDPVVVDRARRYQRGETWERAG
ncbi:MAG TPA: HEAT repeat domain-containing protein [Pirellulales bacterium]|jgi:HEAT repeat protein|nr:HEAT repeat domain-containing protein [Pirellulales bacterium]